MQISAAISNAKWDNII